MEVFFMNQQNVFLVSVENEKLMQVDYAGRPVKEIGVTMSQYQDALKVIAGYKEKLVEAGILKKEKTMQEIQEEQTQILKALMDRIDNLEKKKDENESKPNTSNAEELVA